MKKSKAWLRKAKRTWFISTRRLRVMPVLISLFLLPLLTACSSSKITYVPAPIVPISADLTAKTPAPDIPQPFTYGASVELNAMLYTALGQCNIDKAAIREIEESRASQK